MSDPRRVGGSPTLRPYSPIVPLLIVLLLTGCTPSLPRTWDTARALLRGEPAPIPVGADGRAIFDFPVEMARVERVVDGDTIVLAGGERVRYSGGRVCHKKSLNLPISAKRLGD